NGRELTGTKILQIRKPKEEFAFKNIAAKPYLSLLRDFSAPVRLVYPYSDEDLLFLLAHDSDPFNRFEAAQKLSMKYLLQMVKTKSTAVPAKAIRLMDSIGALLRDTRADAAFKALTIVPPTEAEIGLAIRAEGGFINP